MPQGAALGSLGEAACLSSAPWSWHARRAQASHIQTNCELVSLRQNADTGAWLAVYYNSEQDR